EDEERGIVRDCHARRAAGANGFGGGRPGERRSAEESDERRTAEANQGSAGRINASGADGFRASALPGTAAAGNRRDAGNHRGGSQELPLPRDTEDALGARRFCMTDCEVIRDQFALYLYGELTFDEE